MKAAIVIALMPLVAGAAFAQGAASDIVAVLDTNRDGAVSREEFSAESAANFARSDRNRDGRLTGDEKRLHHGRPAPDQTQAEFMTMAVRMFESEDTNRDGTIAGDEVGRFRAHVARGNEPLPDRRN